LREYFQKHVHTTKDQLTLLTAVAVRDIGKTPTLLGEVSKTMGPISPAPNHDRIAYLALSLHIDPAFDSLSSEDRREITLGMHVGEKLNIAQLAQAENVPGSILPIISLKGENKALHLKILEVLLDFASAGGHIDIRARFSICGTASNAVKIA